METFRNDQRRLRVVVDSENAVDMVVHSRHLRDVIVLVIRGFAQKFNSTSLNSLLKIDAWNLKRVDCVYLQVFFCVPFNVMVMKTKSDCPMNRALPEFHILIFRFGLHGWRIYNKVKKSVRMLNEPLWFKLFIILYLCLLRTIFTHMWN